MEAGMSSEAPKITGFVPVTRKFIGSNTGWLFNLIMSHILFWIFGFTALIEYGYSDLNQDDNGQIVSGPSGSGVGIITGILVVLSSLIVITKAFTFDPNVEA